MTPFPTLSILNGSNEVALGPPSWVHMHRSSSSSSPPAGTTGTGWAVGTDHIKHFPQMFSSSTDFGATAGHTASHPHSSRPSHPADAGGPVQGGKRLALDNNSISHPAPSILRCPGYRGPGSGRTAAGRWPCLDTLLSSLVASLAFFLQGGLCRYSYKHYTLVGWTVCGGGGADPREKEM